MSNFISTFKVGLRAAIAAVWPEVKANGIWEAESLDTFLWSGTEIPYAVFQLVDPVASDQWGTVNRAYEVTVQIVFVGQTDGDITTLQQKIEDAAGYFKSHNVDGGQVIDIEGMSWGDGNNGNVVFAEKFYPQRALSLSVQFVIGEAGP